VIDLLSKLVGMGESAGRRGEMDWACGFEMTWARLKVVLVRVNSGVLGWGGLEILFVLSIVNGLFYLKNAKCTLTAHFGSMGRSYSPWSPCKCHDPKRPAIHSLIQFACTFSSSR
jgi:hypothetical protein